MRSTLPLIRLAALLALALPFACREARAQSSVFTVPTGEVLSEGESYLEFDFDTHPTNSASGGFQSYGIFFVHGARKNVEVGINAYFLKDGAESEAVELQSNIKWRFYQNEDAGLSAAVGAILYAPAGRGGGDTVGSIYASATKKVSPLGDAKLTGGGYGLVGQNSDGGRRAGALLGYEQPLTRKLSFMADWVTGRNRFGYAAAGFGLTLPKDSWLSSAFYFGNEGRGNNFLGVYYGRTF